MLDDDDGEVELLLFDKKIMERASLTINVGIEDEEVIELFVLDMGY
jgi:hypothetical protein